MDSGGQQSSSWLFLVRLWVDDADSGDVAWRGRLVHVLSGQAHDFRDWHTLATLLQEMTPLELGPQASQAGTGEV